jgi:hypothetical protein
LIATDKSSTSPLISQGVACESVRNRLPLLRGPGCRFKRTGRTHVARRNALRVPIIPSWSCGKELRRTLGVAPNRVLGARWMRPDEHLGLAARLTFLTLCVTASVGRATCPRTHCESGDFTCYPTRTLTTFGTSNRGIALATPDE